MVDTSYRRIELSFRKIAKRFRHTREKNCLIVQTTLALAVAVIGIKLGKLLFAFLGDVGPHPLRTALSVAYGSSLVRIGSVIAGAFVAGKVLCPRWKWLAAALPVIVVFLYKAVQALLTWRPVRSFSLTQAGVESRLILPLVVGAIRVVGAVIRMDVLFLATFAIFVYVVVMLTPAKYHRALRILLATFTSFLLFVSGLELANYCKTGVTGTGQLLRFFVTNAASLLPMLRTAIDIVAISALVAPLVVGLVIALLVDRWYLRLERLSFRWPVKLFPVVIAFVLVAGFLHPTSQDRRFHLLLENTYLGLRDLASWRNAGQIEAMKRASGLPPLFDMSKAVLRDRGGAPAIPRNVIIIMLESARADSTSVYNPILGNTPFLADLAKRGAVVQDMYAIIPRTSAAWVAVLDGMWPSPEDEIRNWARREQRQLNTLPALLATRGYASAFFTSASLSFGYDAPLVKNMRFDSVSYAETLPHLGFERPTFWGFEDRIMLEPSLDWVKVQSDKRNPFLLVMMTNIGHYDYRYPSPWQTRTLDNVDQNRNRYLNCLSYVDSMVQDFVTGLEKLGVLHSSIIIIIGDHGESFGEHGARGRSLLAYDETLRIPGIIYADGLIPPGTSISGLRQEIDVEPTVFDALGLNAENATLPGSSLLKPVPADRPLYFFATLDSYSMAVRRGSLKFIYNFDRSPTEAYAIDQDPGEQHDIAGMLPRRTIEEADMDMLVWRERALQPFVALDTNGLGRAQKERSDTATAPTKGIRPR